ncbi:hypothetical protein ABZ801_15155 [Actinomadura sp. NPDC047616]|uniref:hypothetical protein n=1 Tax=Actinomadura sp. NPDC047616 TaxID=3155914 RepID=UPI0033FED811
MWVVTEIRDGESFTWTTGGRGLRFTAGHELRDGAGGEVTVVLTFEVSGPLAPLATLLAGRTIRDHVDTEARSLKAWCEAHRG